MFGRPRLGSAPLQEPPKRFEVFQELPEELQLRVFGALSLDERSRGAALVCRHWRALCATPQLLRDVSVSMELRHSQHLLFPLSLPRLQYMRSHFLFLHTHVAPHVERLCIYLTAPSEAWGHWQEADAHAVIAQDTAILAELPQALAALLAAACSNGRLRELELEVDDVAVPLGPWLLPAAGTLHSLHVCQHTHDLVVPATGLLHRLTALQRLLLAGHEVSRLVLEAGCTLPPRLTSLCLGTSEDDGPALPAALSALSALQRLKLTGHYDPASCDVLASLPALCCLAWNGCLAVPPGLSRLAALRELRLEQRHRLLNPGPGPREEVDLQAIDSAQDFLGRGCGALHGLTALRLRLAREVPIGALPADLGARLPALQRLCWDSYNADGQLPAGLAALAELTLPTPVAERSAAQLAAATGLESLALVERVARWRAPGDWEREQASVAKLVCQLPSLRRLRWDGRCYSGACVDGQLVPLPHSAGRCDAIERWQQQILSKSKASARAMSSQAAHSGRVQQRRAQLQLCDLPEELQLRVLGALSLPERWCHAAPVCRHWRMLCSSPQLLRNVSVRPPLKHSGLSRCKLPLVQRLRASFEFLQTHVAPHAECLELDIDAPLELDEYEAAELEYTPARLAAERAVRAELPLALAALLGAACSNGRLRELCVVAADIPVPLGPWLLPAASTLRRLHISQETDELVVPASGVLPRLTTLQDLTLCACNIANLVFEPQSRLPSQSLTSLSLTTSYSSTPRLLPPSLAELSALQRLELDGHFSDASCDVLASLPALRCLACVNCWAPPPALSRLTALHALSIDHIHYNNCDLSATGRVATRAFLECGLTRLHQLTSLHLRLAPQLAISELLADLGTYLPALQRLGWESDKDDGQLPDGFTALRDLLLPIALAECSAAQLAAASALESLALFDRSYLRRPADQWPRQAAALSQLVLQLPSLRRLRLPGRDYDRHPGLRDGLLQLPPAVTLEGFIVWDPL